MKNIDILTKDKLYGDMIFEELRNAGYNPTLGRSKKADLIIVDTDNTEIFSTEIPLITYSQNSETDLSKPFLIIDLLSKIGEMLSSPKATKENSIELGGGRCYFGEESVELTPLEFQLLSYILERKGSVVSADEIAKEIFKTDDLNSVRVYIHYLRKKIDNTFSRKIILSIHGKGYLIK